MAFHLILPSRQNIHALLESELHDHFGQDQLRLERCNTHYAHDYPVQKLFHSKKYAYLINIIKLSDTAITDIKQNVESKLTENKMKSYITHLEQNLRNFDVKYNDNKSENIPNLVKYYIHGITEWFKNEIDYDPAKYASSDNYTYNKIKNLLNKTYNGHSISEHISKLNTITENHKECCKDDPLLQEIIRIKNNLSSAQLELTTVFKTFNREHTNVENLYKCCVCNDSNCRLVTDKTTDKKKDKKINWYIYEDIRITVNYILYIPILKLILFTYRIFYLTKKLQFSVSSSQFLLSKKIYY